MRFILASASPARLRTLRDAGVEPEVIVSGFDEDAVLGNSPHELVQLLADAKAATVAAATAGAALVLGCDSMLELDAEILGKPTDAAEAAKRWRQMRSRTGMLHTGHSLLRLPDGASARGVASTEVRFADVSDSEIEDYIGTGEPLRVAGAFTIDGLGGWFVESIDGDHHNVVGLSLPLLRHLLHELGVAISELPSSSRNAQ